MTVIAERRTCTLQETFLSAKARRQRCCAACLCVLSLAGLGVANAPGQDAATKTLHVYTNLVQIPTLVLSEDRKPIAQIVGGKFFVSLDEGPRFQVTHARLEGDDPISLAILLDVSQPFPTLMKKMDDAIAGLAPLSLRPHDHVSIYAMDCHLVESAAELPADSATLKRAVESALAPWRTEGRHRWKRGCQRPWNLWDSLESASIALHEQPGRRVILVVTDGIDRGSKTPWNTLRTDAQARGVAIFGLVQAENPMMQSQTEHLFHSVCELTGGIVLSASRKDLDAELKQFTTMVRGRYIIEFPHPVDTVGGSHSMEITMEAGQAFIRPSGISVPVDDANILKDETTVPQDASHAPTVGKRKVLTPK